MPLSAKLIDKTWNNGLASFVIEFTDKETGNTFTRTTGQLQSPGDDLLPTFVAHVTRAYDSMRVYFDSQGVGREIVPQSLDPTADEIAADKFFRDVARLTNLRTMRPANDPDVIALTQSVKSRFEANQKYADDPRWPR